jgi:WhiB family redox-sensing transcriptional regulator
MSDWESEAACRPFPVSLFFPSRGDMAAVAAAKLICFGCPVKAQCLEAALAEESASSAALSGIRGGLSPGRRAAMIRARRLVPLGR